MDQKKRIQHWRAGCWVDGAERVWSVKEMEDRHLVNAFKVLKERARQQYARNVAFYISTPEPSGDGALMAFKQEFDFAVNNDSPERYLIGHPLWPHLMREVLRRGRAEKWLAQFGVREDDLNWLERIIEERLQRNEAAMSYYIEVDEDEDQYDPAYFDWDYD